MVERFRDELGDWRIVLHSPYGAAVHAPWALVISARMRERYGVDVAAMHADDGIVLRLPGRRVRGRAAGLRRVRGARPADPGGRGDRGDRRRGDLRRPVPGVRGPGVAVAAPADRQAAAAVAAAAAGDPAARGGLGVPVVPDRRRGGAGVPVRRVRRARAGRADARAGGPDGADRGGDDASRRRRSRPRCCSATSRSSSTRATRRWPSGGPPRSPSTRPCWPNCSGTATGWRCGTCWIRTRWPTSRPSCSGSPRTGVPGMSTRSPTCSGFSVR